MKSAVWLAATALIPLTGAAAASDDGVSKALHQLFTDEQAFTWKEDPLTASYDGQRTYKKKWGVAFEDHGYFMLSADTAQAPSTFNSSSRGMTSLAKIWSDYVPEKVAEFTGPFIRKQLVR